MLVEFSIIPVGVGESLSSTIAGVMNIVDKSGLPYKATAMGTIVEGEWDEVMSLIGRCHDDVLKKASRVVSNISIDIRPSKPANRITEKIKAVEQQLKREIKK